MDTEHKNLIIAEIATKFMGWIPAEVNWWLQPAELFNCNPKNADVWLHEVDQNSYGIEYNGKKYQGIRSFDFEPFLDLKAAFMIADKMKNDSIPFGLATALGQYACSVSRFEALADTAQEAITMAVYKWMEAGGMKEWQ